MVVAQKSPALTLLSTALQYVPDWQSQVLRCTGLQTLTFELSNNEYIKSCGIPNDDDNKAAPLEQRLTKLTQAAPKLAYQHCNHLT
jgi:hypothetical protein